MSSAPKDEPYEVRERRGGFTVLPRHGIAFSIHVAGRATVDGERPAVLVNADGVRSVDELVVFERAMFQAIALVTSRFRERPILGHETRRKDER